MPVNFFDFWVVLHLIVFICNLGCQVELFLNLLDFIIHIHPIESLRKGKALLQKTCALLSSQLKEGRRLLVENQDKLEMLSIFYSIFV